MTVRIGAPWALENLGVVLAPAVVVPPVYHKSPASDNQQEEDQGVGEGACSTSNPSVAVVAVGRNLPCFLYPTAPGVSVITHP